MKMKKTILLLVILTVSLAAQGWERVLKTDGIPNVYNIVAGFDGNIRMSNLGFGVFYSTNNGNSWQQEENLPTNDINFLHTDSKGRNYVGSIYRMLYRSNASGTSYELLYTFDGDNPKYIYEISEDSLLLVTQREVFILSGDDGITWDTLSVNFPGEQLKKLEKDSRNNFYAHVTGYKIYKANISNFTWELLPRPEGDVDDFTLIDDSTMYVGIDTVIYRLDLNKGVSDSLSKLPDFFHKLDYAGDGRFVIYHFNKVFYSDDYCETWQQIFYENHWIIKQLTTSDYSYLYLYDRALNRLDYSDFSTKLIYDEGEGHSRARDIEIDSLGRIYSAWDHKGVIYSDDEGESWIRTNLNFFNVYDIEFNNVGDVIAGGDGIFISTDRGMNWSRTSYISTLSLKTLNNGTILAGTDVGKLLYSYDNGNTWGAEVQLINMAAKYYAGLHDFEQSEDSTIFLTGYYIWSDYGDLVSLFYKSTNFGANWQLNYLEGFDPYPLDVHVNKNGNIFLGGLNGLGKSTDGGLNYQKITNLPGLNYGVQSINKIRARELLLGYSRGIYLSEDDGESWEPYYDSGLPDFDEKYKLIRNPNGKLFIACGSGIYRFGKTLTSSESGLTSCDKFSLSSNYPNPFNPSTKILYTIPRESFVRLDVYDVTGQRIEFLVNQEKPAGDYEAVFDASGLSSGVYYYRLSAGEYRQTKKMLLLK